MTQLRKSHYKGFNYQTIEIKEKKNIVTVVLTNGAVNVLSGLMIKELSKLLKDLSTDQNIKVIVFESSNSEFFIAHVDINILDEQNILNELSEAAPKNINLFQAVGEMLRHQPQVTIVKLRGIARGGGAEFVTAADMVFASIEKGKLAQCEALMGIIPGGGATQYLQFKMTRGRVLEVILGADLMDARTAELYGWVNRALPDIELDGFVARLAQNIADLPDGVIEVTKHVLSPVVDIKGFQSENHGWAKLAFKQGTTDIFKQAMKNGAQTVEGELKLEELLRSFK